MSTAIKMEILCLSAVLILTGCAPGLLYTNTVTPYSKDFRSRDFTGTPVGTRECIIDDYTLKDPFFTGISAEWTENVIRKEAKKAGIKEIYYMDIKTLSIILGIYQHKYYIVYGD